MKATKLMTKAMTRDEITNTPRFDSKRVESLVLDELNIARNDLTDFAYNSPKVRLARVVIARIMTQHCGRFGRSETACRDAIAKRIGISQMHVSRLQRTALNKPKSSLIKQSSA